MNQNSFNFADYIAPSVKLILVNQGEVILNKIISKNKTFKEIFYENNINQDAEFTLFERPLNINQKVCDLIPKTNDKLAEIELIIETDLMVTENTEKNSNYIRLLKPYSNPFRILLFSPSESNISIKKFSQISLENLGLNFFSTQAFAHCNTPDFLFISGGNSTKEKGTKDFWKINNITLNIEKISDLPIEKEYHSMLYMPKKFIYFIGGIIIKLFIIIYILNHLKIGPL